ncbi:hypothetical protein [Escherichia coli]|nr:hypothetical protein [Escherichia coli]MCF4225012.1 hypothetical protein [Acinetobacter baumannii]MCV5086684.1 hypothetical protein [Escherichia coli]MCV5187442.1 hypothetical protein [Escherichia coli]
MISRQRLLLFQIAG